MRSSTIVLTVGLLAIPLSLLAAPDATPPITLTTFPVTVAAPIEGTVNGRVLTDAPVPSVGPAGISPVDRVAGSGSRTLDAGPINSTPFSSTPTGTLRGGGDEGSQRDRALTPADSADATPNLGR